jgi:hypothetical protein
MNRDVFVEEAHGLVLFSLRIFSLLSLIFRSFLSELSGESSAPKSNSLSKISDAGEEKFSLIFKLDLDEHGTVLGFSSVTVKDKRNQKL